MNYTRRSLAATVVATMLIGCQREEPSPAAPPEGTQQVQPAPAPPKAKASSADADAETLFEAYRRQVGEQKWNEADATLRKLEAMKAAVSQSLRDEIENSRAGFDAARQMNVEPGSAGRQ